MAKSNSIDNIVKDIQRRMVQGIDDAAKQLSDKVSQKADKFYDDYDPDYYTRTYSLQSIDEIPTTISGNTVVGGIVNTANEKSNLHSGDWDVTYSLPSFYIDDPWTSKEVFEYSWIGNHGEFKVNGGALNVWYIDMQTANKCIVEGMRKAGLNLTK